MEEGRKGGGFLYKCLSLSASRCHHLKAFGSSESVGRVDLKCPLAQTRACIHISSHKFLCGIGTGRRSENQPLSDRRQQICMLRISFACINSCDHATLLQDRPLFTTLMHAVNGALMLVPQLSTQTGIC